VLREIVEAPEYTAQLEALGNIRELDQSLRGVMWGLHTQAEKYPFVPEFRTIRIAKSWPNKLAIIFQIQGNRVLLKWIERFDEPGIFDDDDENE
jgi:hypothetical protein